MRNNESVHNLTKEGMKVVSNNAVFFISFLLDCVTTYTACQIVHIPGVGLSGGLEEENAYFQDCYLPSKQLTQFLLPVIPALGHPVEDWWMNRSHDKADAVTSGSSAWRFQLASSGNLV